MASSMASEHKSLNSPAGSWQRAQVVSGGLLDWAMSEMVCVSSNTGISSGSAASSSRAARRRPADVASHSISLLPAHPAPGNMCYSGDEDSEDSGESGPSAQSATPSQGSGSCSADKGSGSCSPAGSQRPTEGRAPEDSDSSDNSIMKMSYRQPV